MQSQIDPSKPLSDAPRVSAIRANFAIIKQEIEQIGTAAENLALGLANLTATVDIQANALLTLTNRVTTLEANSGGGPPPPPPPPPPLIPPNVSMSSGLPLTSSDGADITFYARLSLSMASGTLSGFVITVDVTDDTGTRRATPANNALPGSPLTAYFPGDVTGGQEIDIPFLLPSRDSTQVSFLVTANEQPEFQAWQSQFNGPYTPPAP